MDFVRRWWAQIRVQLSQLKTSDKITIGTLATVIPILLFVVMQYASTPQMVPVLDQPMGPQQQGQITAYLQSRGVKYQLVGDRVMVPSEDQPSVLAGLQMQQLLPEDTSQGFNALIEKDTWWRSNAQNRQLYNLALQAELSRIVMEFPGVRSATVIISRPQEEGFAKTALRPSASVNVITQGPRIDQKKADAIAGLVSGAVAEMRPEDVTVVDAVAMRQWKVRPDGELMPGDAMETIKAQEAYYHDKISSLLTSYIPKAIVAVNVSVDLTRKQTNSTTFSKDDSVSLVTRERSSNTQTTDKSSAGEPGVRANTALSVPGSSTVGRSSTTEEQETEFDAHAGRTDTISTQPGGLPTRISATVNVPRSYFVALFNRGKQADAPEPTDDALQPIIDAELANIRSQVEPLINAQEPGQLVVAVYPDDAIVAMGAEMGVPGLGGSPASLVERYTPHLGLGALALIAVAFMFWTVRRAGQRPAMPSVEELAGVPPIIASEGEFVGQAEEGDQALTGMEVDEQVMRTRKLSEQVSEMVKANPGDAAMLLRRWIQKQD